MPKPDKNAQCSCGSGRKFKKCCGAPEPALTNAEEKATPDTAALPSGAYANPLLNAMKTGQKPELTPDQTQQMQQFMQMMQRLPKGQLQQIQSLMHKAMSGKDVSRDAALLEKSLPPQFMEMAKGLQGMGGMPQVPQSAMGPQSLSAGGAPEMSEEEARRIVEAAAKQGKLSEEKAQDLLSAPEKQRGLKKWFKGFSGK